MYRKGKFKSGKSYQRPFVVHCIRNKNGVLDYGRSNSRALKRDTNRKIRHLPIEDVGSFGHYKRAAMRLIWLYNGDLKDGPFKLHVYLEPYMDENILDHVIIKGGKRYFPKR